LNIVTHRLVFLRQLGQRALQPELWAADPVPGSGQNWRFLGLENYLVVREGPTVWCDLQQCLQPNNISGQFKKKKIVLGELQTKVQVSCYSHSRVLTCEVRKPRLPFPALKYRTFFPTCSSNCCQTLPNLS